MKPISRRTVRRMVERRLAKNQEQLKKKKEREANMPHPTPNPCIVCKELTEGGANDWVLGWIPCCKECFEKKTSKELRDLVMSGFNGEIL